MLPVSSGRSEMLTCWYVYISINFAIYIGRLVFFWVMKIRMLQLDGYVIRMWKQELPSEFL
jgi:hypothetical protein